MNITRAIYTTENRWKSIFVSKRSNRNSPIFFRCTDMTRISTLNFVVRYTARLKNSKSGRTLRRYQYFLNHEFIQTT